MSDKRKPEQNSSLGSPIPGSGSMAGDSSISVGDFIVAKDAETKLESWIDRVSDFCSSILVKETRQAIKSRQFFLTFMFLLSVITIWTFFALSPGRREYDVDSLGSFLLFGFLLILGVPLVLIIPFTTFRSLAQEYEDGTIDMVLITTMKPHQIIAGKLGSAMLQVLIYVSVLAPCIAFCYLLRGVDISQIYYSIGGGLVITFGLCCLAIALASSADSSRVVQVLSVFLILGLLFVAWMWCFAAYGICFEPIPSGQKSMINLILSGPFLAIISTAVILYFAASAKIAFPSSNRSTMIRVGVTIQIVLFVGWLLSMMSVFGFEKYVFMFSSVSSMHYLLLIGSMMIACHSGMSPRVRRSLPSSKL
jgi:ABC-type transport system involved in cytochrome c biogenesis permease component